MIFLSGPRQVGKTTFAKSLQSFFQNSIYLNYDAEEDRNIIDRKSWSAHLDLIILDEIHKKRNWKNYLKGLFDTKPKNLKILVTGSARLETFRKGGDSLTGRYFSLRMMPLSPRELKLDKINTNMEDLLARGGFPEPFFAESSIDRDRWRNQYMDTMVRQDVLDFENISEIRSMQFLVELLKKRTGSPISYRSLSEDLSISPNTVKRYIEILEALYLVFRVVPFSKKIQRAIQREPKFYFFDWNLIENEGARLENFFAVCLLKHIYASNDILGKRLELRYLRTKDGREIDFCIVENDRLLRAYEVKTSENVPSKNCLWYKEHFDFNITQVVRFLRLESEEKNISVVPMEKELENFFL